MKFLLQITLVFIIFWKIRSEYVDILTNSTTCPGENMIFHPLDENYTSWICDCVLDNLYFPGTGSCYEPYRQGPCPSGNYLVLSRDKKGGECEKNPCFEDGLVPYNEKCYVLGKSDQKCGLIKHTSILVRNFTIVCSYSVSFGIINAPKKNCPIGSRRIATGFCKQVL